MSPETGSLGHNHASRGNFRNGDDRDNSRNPKREYSHNSDRRHRSRDDSRDRKRRRRSDSPDKPKRRHSRERAPDVRRDRERDPERESRRRRSPDARDERRRGDRNKDETRARRKSPDGESSRQRRNDYDKPTGVARGKQSDGKDKPASRQQGPLPSQEASFAVEKGEEPSQPVEKANFGTTGRLAAASNSITKSDGTSVALKYHEPAEARKPPSSNQYKLFAFKGADIIDEIALNSRTCWLIGRDKAIVDYAAEHPSISKQHAVIQFRYVEKRNEFGDKMGKVKPYLLDLQSANGTALNGEEIADSRYYEIREKDMVQFGDSTREYVLMLAK